jgi:hypothetical protein
MEFDKSVFPEKCIDPRDCREVLRQPWLNVEKRELRTL